MENGCDLDCRVYNNIEFDNGPHGWSRCLICLVNFDFVYKKWNIMIFNLFLHDYVEQTLEGL